MNKKYFLFIVPLAIAALTNACADLKPSKVESTTFSTSTPLTKVSFFKGVWVRQEDIEKLENEPEYFCQLKKINDNEENTFTLEWLEVDEEGRLSFDKPSNTQTDPLKNIAHIDNEGHIKANEKLKAIEKNRFDKELEKCLKENKGMDKFYMSDKDFEQSFEMEGQTMIVNFVHTSYYCQEDKKIFFDEVSATTYNYQKVSKQELKKWANNYKDICD